MNKYLYFISLVVMTCFSCQGENQTSASEAAPLHNQFTELLQRHVKKQLVNYKGLQKDSIILDRYLQFLNNNAPNKLTWTKNQQLAYWINTYNAFTLKLIIDNYPIQSITNLHPTFYVPLLNTVWHKKIFEIGGRKISLDEIEHAILRREFDDPRIHFAINCASYSCPPLRNEAYTSEILDQQLDEQAVLFINDQKRNEIFSDRVEVSKIFSWFNRDFTKNGSLIDFLNKYSQLKINKNAKIEFMDYDWRLNDYE